MRRSSVAIAFAVAAGLAAPARGAEKARDAALQALVDGAKASHSDAMMVVHDGQVLASFRKPGSTSRGIEMMSATKSLVGLAVGRLITQGKLKSIDQPVSDFYPEWRQGQKAKITIKMLLDHTSGLENVPNTSVEIYPAPDGLKLALAAELSSPPGTSFSYNNKAMNLLAGVIQKASGQRMDLYIEQNVLAPLGVTAPAWNPDGYDRAGNPYAMAGWNATAEDAVKVGELVLNEGRWEGKPLVDASYVKEMVGQSQPFNKQYGLLWWRRSGEVALQVVDEKGLAALEQKGMKKALLDELRPLAGKTFHSDLELFKALTGALGSDLQALRADARGHGASLVADRSGPIVAYEANGWLGQYIVVVPRAKLVAVRQIAAPAQLDGSKPWPYGYDDFTARVVKLARTFTQDLAVPN